MALLSEFDGAAAVRAMTEDPSVTDWRQVLKEEHEKKGCWGVDHMNGCEAPDPRNHMSADEADVSRLEKQIALQKQARYTYPSTDAGDVPAGTKFEHSIKRPATPFEKSLLGDPFELALDAILAELRSTMLRKHRDYGPFNIAHAPGGAVNGLRVRMHDKLARINNLYDTAAGPENEPLEDSFLDLSNYGIIGLMVLRGHWPGTEKGYW